MKAIILENAGGADKLISTELPIPTLKLGEVLIKVRSISINPVDIKTRNGKALYNSLIGSGNIILGWDIAGDIVETLGDTGSFKIGDAVFGMINFPNEGKAYAEFVAAPASDLCLKPVMLSYDDAAAASLAALTAWQSLIHIAKIQKGETILIHAAAGGVGHFAVQIAKHIGAKVIGTASVSNHAFLKSLGADEVLDYSESNIFENYKETVDVVLDPIGGNTTKISYSMLKANGRLVSIVGGVKEEDNLLRESKNIVAENYLVKTSGKDLLEIVKLIQQGHLKVFVSHVFPFNKIAEAHLQIESNKTKGKVVINVK